MEGADRNWIKGNQRVLDTLVNFTPRLLKPEGPQQRQRRNWPWAQGRKIQLKDSS